MCVHCSNLYSVLPASVDLRTASAASVNVTPGAWAAAGLCQLPAAAQTILATFTTVGAKVDLSDCFGGNLDGGESQVLWLGMDMAVAWLVSQGYVHHYSGAGWRGVYALSAKGAVVRPALLAANYPVSD